MSALTIRPPIFLHLERKLSKYEFVNFQSLDIEIDPQEQGFEKESFDIVLASSVLHETTNLKKSLSHIAMLLRPGGLLTFTEIGQASPFMDTVFGMMEGWRRFTDTDLRPKSPVLNRQQWLPLMVETGFEDVQIIPPEGDAMQILLWGRKASNREKTSPTHVSDLTEKETTPNGTWVIFADKSGIGQSLVPVLESQGSSCILIRPGDAFSLTEDSCFTIRPDHLEDYAQVFQVVSNKPFPIAGIVHAWATDLDNSKEIGSQELESSGITRMHQRVELHSSHGI